MLIMGIEVTVPGSKVGCKIGDPTNIDNKSESDSTTSATNAASTNGRHQTSKYHYLVNYICG